MGLIDVCYLDEAGFSMTLPPCRSWFPRGERLEVAYQAPEGRRVNAIGAHFTHGPEAGRFEYQSWATLPKSRAKKQRKSAAQRAAAQGLGEDEIGPITSERLLGFIWRAAGRDPEAGEGWVRECALMVVLDNYSVHRSELVEAAVEELKAAGVHLEYLPSYSPELSRIEPDWNDIKQHHLPIRSFEKVAELKRAVDDALARKAHHLQQAHAKATNLRQADT
jgi:putative transposase